MKGKVSYHHPQLNMNVVGFATVPMLLHRPTVRVRTFFDPTCVTGGGGQCTRVHRLGVQKRAKLGEKRVCFWSY